MHHNRLKYILLSVACLQFSCKKFLEIDPPKSSLVQETVFQNNDQAMSAIIGIYATMSTPANYASGGSSSITFYLGVSADELTGYSETNIPFYENQLTPENSKSANLYSTIYKSIYTENAVLEGLEAPNGITPPVKAQLKGEALFVRAFNYFYLVNLYGPVPLQLNTDYMITQVAARATVERVYQQIISDLKSAEDLLSESYPSAERVRPNRSAVQSLLARTYLYLRDWENADKYASLVIAKTDTYSLVNLDTVFMANSKETIWQLMPASNTNTQEGNMFILSTTPPLVSLRSSFALNAFEANDKRQTVWVKSYTNNTGTYYYPFKYKVKSSTITIEYSMVLRLAEQYLIRAEARINQGRIDVGIADLNLIRDRARPVATINSPNPLPPLSTTLSKIEALLAVEQERKVELFSEWGHRWLDLKRTDRADALLSPIKLQWQPTDVLYPIPMSELNQNRNITQNEGY